MKCVKEMQVQPERYSSEKRLLKSELNALNNIKDDIEVDLRQLLDEALEGSDLERLCDRVGSQLQFKSKNYTKVLKIAD